MTIAPPESLASLVRLGAGPLFVHARMGLLADERLEDRRPLVEFVLGAALEAAEAAAGPGIEFLPSVSLAGSGAVSRLAAPPSDLDVSIHLLVRLEPGWIRTSRVREDRLVAHLLRFHAALLVALDVPGRTTFHVGRALRKDGARLLERRELSREELCAPMRTPDLARSVGGALFDGVLALDVAVLTDAGPLKLDLRLVTSVWQPWGPSKICHGYDSLWFGRAFFDEGSVRTMAAIHAHAGQLAAAGAPPSVDTEYVYTRMSAHGRERGHWLDHLKKRLRLHAWHDEPREVEALLDSPMPALCTAWAVAARIRYAIELTTLGRCDRKLLVGALVHGTDVLERNGLLELSPAIADGARYLSDVVAFVPEHLYGHLWAKAEELRAELVETCNRHAHDLVASLDAARAGEATDVNRSSLVPRSE